MAMIVPPMVSVFLCFTSLYTIQDTFWNISAPWSPNGVLLPILQGMWTLLLFLWTVDCNKKEAYFFTPLIGTFKDPFCTKIGRMLQSPLPNSLQDSQKFLRAVG